MPDPLFPRKISCLAVVSTLGKEPSVLVYGPVRRTSGQPKVYGQLCYTERSQKVADYFLSFFFASALLLDAEAAGDASIQQAQVGLRSHI